VGHGARQRTPPRSPAQQHAPLPNLPLPRPTACFNRGYHSGALGYRL
ncbi:MAG: hypothetical protein, partial [Olavius algarvensis Gamma 1 endosymbiont]